jgi:hypothetical protein
MDLSSIEKFYNQYGIKNNPDQTIQNTLVSSFKHEMPSAYKKVDLKCDTKTMPQKNT